MELKECLPQVLYRIVCISRIHSMELKGYEGACGNANPRYSRPNPFNGIERLDITVIIV